MNGEHVEKYIALLERLHHLIACGMGESEAADELRDRMDTSWKGMTKDEHDYVRKVSAELYKIEEV